MFIIFGILILVIVVLFIFMGEDLGNKVVLGIILFVVGVFIVGLVIFYVNYICVEIEEDGFSGFNW